MRQPHTSGRSTATPLLLILLVVVAGCTPVEPNLQRFPTSAPHSLGIEPTWTTEPTPTINLTESPTPIVTVQPAVALPDPTGASIACEANTLRVAMPERSEGVPAMLTRIEAGGEWLYLLMNGGLYRAQSLSIDAGVAEIEPILVPSDEVAGRQVQELVDLNIDPQSGFVYVLDKVGHVFKWVATGQEKSLTYRATSIGEPELPYNLMASAVMDDGSVIALDAAHGTVWTVEGLGDLFPTHSASALEESAEIAVVGDQIYFLTNTGIIRTLDERPGSQVWRSGASVGLGLSLRASYHLGIPMLVLVDGLKREITGMDPDSGETLVRYLYDIEGMGLLRDGVFAGGRLYAISDDTITVYPGPATGDGECETPVYDEIPMPMLQGVDVLDLTDRFLYPIRGGTLPYLSRLYPGAARSYRMGVHHGVDIYSINGPFGFDEGYAVGALGDGTVVRATLNYQEVSEDEFEAMVEQSEALGITPPDLLERFEGRQITIDHGNGIQSVYAHLDSIAPGLVRGKHVSGGQVIGTVGVSGTSAEGKPGTEGPHLHFEIWINGHYLGEGLTIRETIWWFDQIFAGGMF